MLQFSAVREGVAKRCCCFLRGLHDFEVSIINMSAIIYELFILLAALTTFIESKGIKTKLFFSLNFFFNISNYAPKFVLHLLLVCWYIGGVPNSINTKSFFMRLVQLNSSILFSLFTLSWLYGRETLSMTLVAGFCCCCFVLHNLELDSNLCSLSNTQCFSTSKNILPCRCINTTSRIYMITAYNKE